MEPFHNEPGYEHDPGENAAENAVYDEMTGEAYYDEDGNYRSDAFLNLGSLHYMNYLHSHDDML